MRGIFDINSKFMQTLTAVGDYILLNLCFALCCLPVLTIGAAKTALYRAMFDMIEDRGQLYKRFFSAFIHEIGSTILTVLLKAAVLMLLVWELWFVTENQLVLARPVGIGLLIVIWVFGALTSSIYPQIARFSATTKQYWKNSIYIALTHPLQAMLMGLMDFLPLILFFGAPKIFVTIGPVWPFLYFSVTAMFGARMLRKPFEYYIEQNRKEN